MVVIRVFSSIPFVDVSWTVLGVQKPVLFKEAAQLVTLDLVSAS